MGQTTPGFQISWNTNGENVQQTDLSDESDEFWRRSKGTPGQKDFFLVRIVNMVAEARKRNISVEHLLEKAVRFKRKMLKL